MAMPPNFKDIDAKKREHQKRGFDDWMKQPTTRFMISLIPAGENREALETLLENAYESGFGAGGASLAIEMISGFMERKKD